MAIRINTDLQAIYCHEPEGHTVPALNTTWTVAGWYRPEADVNLDSLIVALYGETNYLSSTLNWLGLYMNSDGVSCRLEGRNGPSSAVVSSNYSLTIGRDYPIAIQYNSGTLTFLIDGVVILTLSFTPNAGIAGQRSLQWGGYGDVSGYTSCTLARWRMWSAILTEAELRAEFRSTIPVRTTNLIHDYPMDPGTGRMESTMVGEPDLFQNPAVPVSDGTAFTRTVKGLGTPIWVNIGDSGNPSPFSIDVPEFAEYVGVQLYWTSDGSSQFGLTSIVGNFCEAFTSNDGANTTVAMGAASGYAKVTSTGAGKTLEVDLAGTSSLAGAGMFVYFMEDVDAVVPVSQQNRALATGTGTTAGTSTTSTHGPALVRALDSRLDAASGNYPANQTDWLSLATQQTLGGGIGYYGAARFREISAGTGSVDATTQNTNGSAISSIAWRSALWEGPEVDPDLEYIGETSGTNTASLPSGWQPGDIAIVFSYRDGSNTAPSLPGTFNNIVTGGANTNSSRSGFRILQTGDTSVGTWTNATSVICLVYRANNGGIPSIGASARGSGAATTITYPTLTLQVSDGSSWVIRFAGHRSTNVAIETVPSGGYTYRGATSDATDEAAAFDSNGGKTSVSSGTAAVGGTSSGFEAHTIELKFAYAAPVINTQPSNATVAEGVAALFSVLVNGAELAYQWQRYVTSAGYTAVEVGSPIPIAWPNTANSGPITVNVPAGANAFIIGGTFYQGSGGIVNTLTGNFTPDTLSVANSNLLSWASNANNMGGYIGHGRVTSTGSDRTMTMTASTGYGEGPTGLIQFFTVSDPDDWVRAMGADPASTPDESLSVALTGTTVDDLVFRFVGSDGGSFNFAQTGWTQVGSTQTNNNDRQALYKMNTPTAGTVTATHSGTGFPTLGAISIKGGAGASWVNVSTGTGGNTADYTTEATTLAMSGYQYRCVITNPGGQATTDTVTLTVTEAPTSRLYLYDGAAFQPKTAYIYNGSAFVASVFKLRGASSWVDV